MMAQRKSGPASGLAPRGPEPKADRATWIYRGAFVLGFVVLVAMLTREPARRALPLGDINTDVLSREELRAEFYFQAVDLQKTKEARNEAVAKVPDNYRVDAARVDDQVARVEARIDRIRGLHGAVSTEVLAALRASDSAQAPADIVRQTVSDFVARLKSDPDWQAAPETAALSLWLTPDAASLPQRVFEPAPEGDESDAASAAGSPEVLPARKTVGLDPDPAPPLTFSTAARLESLATESLEYVLSRGIRAAALPPDAETKTIVILRDEPRADLALTSGEVLLKDVPDPVTAGQALAERLRDTARRASGAGTEESGEWARLHEAALAVASPGLAETIQQDRVATAGAVQAARDAVPPVMREIEAGEIIQEGGRRWTEQSRSDAKTYLEILAKESDSPQRLLTSLLSNALIIAMVLTTLRKVLPMFFPENETDESRRQLLVLAVLLMTSAAVIGRIASYFEPSGFLLPVAAAGILYAILVNGRAAALFSLLTVFVVATQYSYDWRLLFVGAAMSLAGVLSISKVRKRSDMTKASLKATAAGLAAMAGVLLASDSLWSDIALQRMTMILLNGGVCLMVVPALQSPLERLFSITTDIQLLEYSDLNNEVLSRLALEIPGTFSHSLMLGQLAEAAADAIGANGLKARVMAYYHDIGKMWRPEYFCENQTDRNVHDELAPRLSARAIAAHVSQGAEMARRMYRLPKPIIDGILEHHGTARIGYFYEEALKQKRHGDVNERDFRYPGPRPQSPETAILMICDGAESASRTLKNPNEERVRELVDKIISARAADRQFDDCNLTMKQLDTIAEVITARLCSNLHKRVAYPSTKRDEDNIIPMSGASA